MLPIAQIMPTLRRAVVRCALSMALCLSAAPAFAEQLSLLVNGKAVHFGKQDDKEVNEDNWGGGVQYDFARRFNDPWKPFVTAAGFKDSNSNPSYYAGGGTMRRFQVTNRLHLDAGGVMFLMTRENYRGGDPFLGVLPALSLGSENVSVNMTYVPKIEPDALPLIFFQLKVAFSGGR